MATREELHEKVDSLSETQLDRVRLVLLDEVASETSVEAILSRHGERRLTPEESGTYPKTAKAEPIR